MMNQKTINEPKVSVIVLNWNGWKDTIKCLESVYQLDYRNYDVFVVDNGSEDNSIEKVKEYCKGKIEVNTPFFEYDPVNKPIRYKEIIFNGISFEPNDEFQIENINIPNLKPGFELTLIKISENRAFAGGNNVGLKYVLGNINSNYIFLISNDIIVNKNFLEIINFAEDHPSSGSFQPKMLWMDYPDKIDSVGLEYSKNGLGFNRGAFTQSNLYNNPEEIFGCCAGACIYRSSSLKDIEFDGQYFDEDFEAYYEDFDLSFRLRWAGWNSWYYPEAVCYHGRGKTCGVLSDFTVYHNWRNYNWVLFKNLPNTYLIKNFYWLLLCDLAQIAVNIKRGQLIIFKAKFDAYKSYRKFLAKKKRIIKRSNFKSIEKFFINKWFP